MELSIVGRWIIYWIEFWITNLFLHFDFLLINHINLENIYSILDVFFALFDIIGSISWVTEKDVYSRCSMWTFQVMSKVFPVGVSGGFSQSCRPHRISSWVPSIEACFKTLFSFPVQQNVTEDGLRICNVHTSVYEYKSFDHRSFSCMLCCLNTSDLPSSFDLRIKKASISSIVSGTTRHWTYWSFERWWLIYLLNSVQAPFIFLHIKPHSVNAHIFPWQDPSERRREKESAFQYEPTP